jgi:hypothetical protein
MFSPETRLYFTNARGLGTLKGPTHRAIMGDPELGHYFELELHLQNGRVLDLAFRCPRCVAAIACGAYLHQKLVGQTFRVISTAELLEGLGGLPVQRSFYAWMAASALENLAVTDS